MAPNYQPMVRMAEVIAGQLAKVGIKVNIEALDTGTYNSKLIGNHDFAMALQDVVIVSPDPDSPIFWFHRKGTQHWHGWGHPEPHARLDQGRETTPWRGVLPRDSPGASSRGSTTRRAPCTRSP